MKDLKHLLKCILCKDISKLWLLLCVFAMINCVSAQSKIYWTDTGTNDIRRADADGTNVEILVSGTNTPRGLEIDFASSQFYFVDGQSERIQKANLDGSGLADVLTGLSEPIDLDLDRDNQHIYFSDNQSHKIQRVNYDGSGLIDIHTGVSIPTDIKLDLVNQKLYWSDWGKNTIDRSNLDGSNVETILCNVRSFFDLDVCNFKIYFTDRLTKTLYKANMNGTCIEGVTPIDQLVKTLTLDLQNQYIYYINNVTHRIERYNFDGSNLVILNAILGDGSFIQTDIQNPSPDCTSAFPSGCIITNQDFDEDGFTVCEGDCNEDDPNNFPGNAEICDGQDNNCDGLVDDDDPLIIGQTTWYLDSDGDGYGDENISVISCSGPQGYVSVSTDCDDTSPETYPGGIEILDGLDNDCDGVIDEDLTYMTIDIGECTTVLLGYEPEECADLSVSITDGTAPYSYAWSTGETSEVISVCPTETTTYDITVTDANNQTAEDQITVQVIDVQCGNGNNPKILICHYPPGNPDNPQTLCISISALETHLTEHGDHVGICGAMDPCADDQGAYISANQLINALQEVNTLALSLEDEHSIKKDEVVIYPNPVSDELSIINTSIISHLRIFTTTGGIVKHFKPLSMETTIDLGDLSPAAYILQIEEENGRKYNKRIIVLK